MIEGYIGMALLIVAILGVVLGLIHYLGFEDL